MLVLRTERLRLRMAKWELPLWKLLGGSPMRKLWASLLSLRMLVLRTEMLR